MSLSRYINTVESGLDLLREKSWKDTTPFQTPAPLSYPVNTSAWRRVTLRWPSKYEWSKAAIFVDALRTGLERFVRVEPADIPQSYRGIVMFHLVLGGRAVPVTIDYFDHFDVIEFDALAKSAVYFKMQYRREGYQDIANALGQRIVPGGFVPGSSSIYHYLRQIRSCSERKVPVFDVYGRFGFAFAQEIRQKAVRLLAEQTRFRFEGGLKLVRHSRSLLDAASSRVCIDLPGNGDFCYRLVDYFAVGTCVVAARHRTALPKPLEDRKHIVYVKDDLSDLVPLCEYYLKHDEERRALARNSREYFDAYLHRDQMAAYYLNECEKRVLAAAS
jgi:hypothetical protein